jgi:aryl-alcohol dehydrogenase-like predicted oxidoreductase
MKKGISRRKFVHHSVLGLGSAGLISGKTLFGQENEDKAPAPNTAKVKKYQKLGKTGFKVSDISLGYSNNQAVVKAVLDAGVNYIDTAESYRNQQIVGKAIKGRDRKKIFITSKLEIKKEAGFDKESFIKRFDKCLEELDTPYIDCMMVHSPDTIEILKTPGFHWAMDEMKKQGKLKHVGVSNHGSNHPVLTKESMETILTAAAEDGRFDVFLMAYNFIQEDKGKKVLEICNQKGIGTTIMKKNPVGTFYRIKAYLERTKKEGKEPNKLYAASLERFKKKAERGEWFIKKYNLQDQSEIRDAAIRFVLNNPHVHSVTCSIRNFDQIEPYLKLSGSNLSVYDKKTLSAYKKGCAQLYCRHACGECESDCPRGVPINTIMRYHHYYAAQSKEKYALKKYARLASPRADQCLNCEGFCEKACSYGVPIQGLLIMAYHDLTLA